MSDTLGIVIAVGGTGAKVAEALVHLTAAGLGPQKLLVGFVDQDSGNGNTSDARSAVESYSAARALWRGAGDHVLDDSNTLLQPVIELLTPHEPVWTPHPDGTTTLNKAVGRLDEFDKALFDLLFEAGENEQDMPLGRGYRARPNIGALAIALAMQANPPFADAISTAIKQVGAGQTVKLVIAGSLFGGTGAAGLPTFAKLIKSLVPKGHEARFGMAGAFMMPYFGFKPPMGDDPTDVAKAEDLLQASRVALRYYVDRQRSGDLPFDRMYMVGWDPFMATLNHSSGSGSQRNPAMVPELIAALGVCQFMRGNDGGADAPKALVSARAVQDAISWTDLPSPTGEALDPYYQLGHALRFAIAFEFWNDHARNQGNVSFFGRFSRDAFFKTQDLGQINWSNSPPQQEAQALLNQGRMLLDWAGKLSASRDAPRTFNLWSRDGFPANLGDETGYKRCYDRALIVPGDTVDRPTDSAHILQQLSSVRGPAGARGLGRMVASIHAATATKTGAQ